jgi:hypothetical protein
MTSGRGRTKDERTINKKRASLTTKHFSATESQCISFFFLKKIEWTLLSPWHGSDGKDVKGDPKAAELFSSGFHSPLPSTEPGHDIF